MDLYLGDCTEQLRHIASDSVDLVVTTYGGVTPDDYVERLLPIADELQRVLKPTGTFVLNIKERVVNDERHTYVLELILAMRERGWLWTEEFVWHKKTVIPAGGPTGFGIRGSGFCNLTDSAFGNVDTELAKFE